MTEVKVIYLVVSGAASARMVPDLVRGLAPLKLPIYTFLTEAAKMLISPYELAVLGENHTLVDSYFAPILGEQRQPGLTVIAPATFNTLNKISQGIADTLPHSLIAEAIGAKWPVLMALAMNQALYQHPRTAQSVETLRDWDVTVLEPRPEVDWLMMAPIEKIVSVAEDMLTK